MACTLDFIEALCGLLAPLGEVRSRKMMGEYVISSGIIFPFQSRNSRIKKQPESEATDDPEKHS